MPALIRIHLLAFSILLGACTPTLQLEPAAPFDPKTAPINAERADRHWWQLRFRLTWPEGEKPDFSKHLLIAEQLLLPVIIEQQEQMPLWRFHRRAGRSNSGHQFSLIFFADKTTAHQIKEAVKSDPLTLWLTSNDMIDKLRFNQRSSEEMERLEQTSDPSWPKEIQRSWPYFIMGASQAWMMQVQELSRENELTGPVDYPTLLQHYREVDERLNAQWKNYAQHAYLHHLSAIFGYQPLIIWSSELKTF